MPCDQELLSHKFPRLAAHLSPESARQLRAAMSQALKDIGEDR